MRALCSIATPQEQVDIRLSLADIEAAAADLIVLEEILQQSLRVEFDPLPDTPAQPFTSLIYYFYAAVSKYTFYTLIERAVHTDRTLDNRHRQLTCGLPMLVQRYVLTNAEDEMCKMMRDDYEQHLQKQVASATPAGLVTSMMC